MQITYVNAQPYDSQWTAEILTPKQVLAEVRRPHGDPSKTFKRAALFSFSLVTILYILANVAYVRQISHILLN